MLLVPLSPPRRGVLRVTDELEKVPATVGSLSVDEVFPSDPLLAPVGHDRDRQQVTELNRVSAFGNTGQQQNLLLDVGRQP